MVINKLETFSQFRDAMIDGSTVYGMTPIKLDETVLSDLMGYDFVAIETEQAQEEQHDMYKLMHQQAQSEISTLQEVIRQLKEDIVADTDIIAKQDEDIEDKDLELTRLRKEVTDLRATVDRMKKAELEGCDNHDKLEPLVSNVSVSIDGTTDVSEMKVTKLKKGDRGGAPTLLDPEKTEIDSDDTQEVWDGEKAKAYYLQCGSTNQTAKHFGVSWITCSNRLKAMGVIE